MLEVMFTDVSNIVMPDNSASTILPHTDQLDFAAHIPDSMLIFEVVGGGTAVDRLQAFATLGVCIKAKCFRTGRILVRLYIHREGLLDGMRCAVGN